MTFLGQVCCIVLSGNRDVREFFDLCLAANNKSIFLKLVKMTKVNPIEVFDL